MIKSKLGPNEMHLIRAGKRHGQRFLVRLKDGEAVVSTLRTRHSGMDGGGVPFNLDEESDGTLRYIDLSMAFHALALKNSGHVFIVDELDRSLHPNLVREAMEAFLAGCGPDSKSQLIVTTHDATLMTQDLFRRDEIWFAEKEPCGSTALHSLGDFKDLRYDTELQRNYLTGRLGGVPIIQHRPLAAQELPVEA
jgi:AAA15 family ATPase/GTPase